MTFTELRKRALVELGLSPTLVEALVNFTSPRGDAIDRDVEDLKELQMVRKDEASPYRAAIEDQALDAIARRTRRDARRRRGPRRPARTDEDDAADLESVIDLLKGV